MASAEAIFLLKKQRPQLAIETASGTASCLQYRGRANL